MAKKFKDYYDRECALLIASRLVEVLGTGSFDRDGFVAEISGGLEEDPPFSTRQDIFAGALERHLPPDYSTAVESLTAIIGPPLQQPEGMFTHGWWLWPIGRYIERNALRERSVSYAFIRELTRRFTGEFAIRPLLREYPEEAFAVLDGWARDADVHVRRCASEGMRIRLPWTTRMTVGLDHFDRFSSVLHHLRADPERFVQKSVGNNLNDLMKEDPDRAWGVIREWEAELTDSAGARGGGAADGGVADGAVADGAVANAAEDVSARATRWIIRHGTRNVRKRAAANETDLHIQ